MSGFERTPLLLAAQAVVGEALTSGPRSGFDLSSKKKWQIMAGCLGATFLGLKDSSPKNQVKSICVELETHFVADYISLDQVLPFRLLKHRTSLLVFIVTICVAVSNFGVMYNLPIWFIVDGLSVSGAGAHLLPTSLGTVVGGSLAGFVISRTGKYHGTSVVAGIFAVLGVFLIANLSPGSSNFMKWFSNFPVGLGFSFILNTSFIALMASVPHSDIPAVTGVQWLFRTCGQVFGVASTAAILQGVLSTELNLHITGPNARKIIKSIREDSSVIERLSPALQLIARQAYRVALRNVFYFALLFAFLAWLSNAFIPNLDLDGKVEPTSVTPPQEQEEV
ncbi:hypothetical protein P7C70_g3786, partial [Phenoliferia sp. Uapishka_3]